MSPFSGIQLVKTRAEAMQYCSDLEPSGMMTVFFGRNAKLGLACDAAREWMRERSGVARPVCEVANFLYSGAKVLGGHQQVGGVSKRGLKTNRVD